MSSLRPEPRVGVEFTVEDGLEAVWDESRIDALVRSIVERELPANRRYAVSLYLVGDATIRALNTRHRGIDADTDVLSFPLYEPETPFVLPPELPANLGDIVVSYPRAREQAEEFGHSPERELAYLVAHGLLHLLGYDHEADQDRRRMRHKEEEALQPLGFTR
jgi:probable rRNA maturation factor